MVVRISVEGMAGVKGWGVSMGHCADYHFQSIAGLFSVLFFGQIGVQARKQVCP